MTHWHPQRPPRLTAATAPAAAPGPAMHLAAPHRDLALLHWAMAALFLLALSGIIGRGLLPAGHPWRPSLRALHILTGQTIFLLALVRLGLRWRHPLPSHPHAPRLTRWASGLVHGLLYGVMLAQPITGVLFMQAGDKQIQFFGLLLPRLLGSNPELHFSLKEAHQTLGNGFYLLFSLHLGAALWHHFVLRDERLRQMLRLRRPARAGHAATLAGMAPASVTPGTAASLSAPAPAAAAPIQVAARSGAASQPAAVLRQDEPVC